MTIALINTLTGEYIASYDDDYPIELQPDQAIVSPPPDDARQRWLGDRWSDVPSPPDWVSFRRALLSSDPWSTIASQTPYDWRVGAIMTAISLDSPDPVIVANLWNNLNKPLTTGQIEWLRGAVTSNHIPLAVADNGTITPT